MQMKSDTRIVTLVYFSNLADSSNFLAVFFLVVFFSSTANQIVSIYIIFSRPHRRHMLSISDTDNINDRIVQVLLSVRNNLTNENIEYRIVSICLPLTNDNADSIS